MQTLGQLLLELVQTVFVVLVLYDEVRHRQCLSLLQVVGASRGTLSYARWSCPTEYVSYSDVRAARVERCGYADTRLHLGEQGGVRGER